MDALTLALDPQELTASQDTTGFREGLRGRLVRKTHLTPFGGVVGSAA